MEILILALFTLILAVFAVTASELGVDSRDMSDDPHRPKYPVAMS